MLNVLQLDATALRGRLPPIPLPIAGFLIRRLVHAAYKSFPDFFERLGQCKQATYLIDPIDLSFVLAMQLMTGHPKLRVYRREQAPTQAKARVSGRFHDLIDLLEGVQDSDALFFSRRLEIEGDTEAIVTLRNALDNLNANVVTDSISALRPPLRLSTWLALCLVRRSHHAA
jgi:O2-independent ubiquinone biosynthesis accessory factor UbiT